MTPPPFPPSPGCTVHSFESAWVVEVFESLLFEDWHAGVSREDGSVNSTMPASRLCGAGGVWHW